MANEEKMPSKLRPDVSEVAHRVMLEATGQAEKTFPPEERSEDEKNPEAGVRILRKLAAIMAERLIAAREQIRSRIRPGLISHG